MVRINETNFAENEPVGLPGIKLLLVEKRLSKNLARKRKSRTCSQSRGVELARQLVYFFFVVVQGKGGRNGLEGKASFTEKKTNSLGSVRSGTPEKMLFVH